MAVDREFDVFCLAMGVPWNLCDREVGWQTARDQTPARAAMTVRPGKGMRGGLDGGWGGGEGTFAAVTTVGSEAAPVEHVAMRRSTRIMSDGRHQRAYVPP